MIKYTEYKYHLAALFTVTVWGATFVSTKVLIANSLTPAEIFVAASPITLSLNPCLSRVEIVMLANGINIL